MSRLVDIVPKRSSGPVDVAAVDTVDALQRHLPLVQDMVDIRYRETIPDDVLPWLLRHWGLEDAAAFMLDHQRLYDEGKHWQTVRGRLAAFAIIFDWLGLDAEYERGTQGDVRWGLSQIGLGEPLLDKMALTNLIGLANLSKRARSKIGRIYSGYDIRPMRLDGQPLGGALLDDWSGQFVSPFEPKLSFGLYRLGVVDFDPFVLQAFSSERVGVARFEEGFILDESKLDQESVEPTVVRIESASITETITLAHPALMPWPRSRWPGLVWGEFQPTAYGGPDGSLG